MAITFISAASANSNTVAITTPTKGDLILVGCWDNAAATVPTVPAGYQSIANTTTTLLGGVCAYKISDGTETSVPAFTNGTQIVVGIYRGSFKVGANGTPTTVNSATLTYPTLSPQIADGTSWVVGLGCDKGWSAGSNGTTAALTSNRTNQTTCNLLDTNGGVVSFAQQSLTGTGSGRGIGFSVELRQAPAPAETLSLSDQARLGYGDAVVDDFAEGPTGTVQLSDGNLDFVLAPKNIAKSDQTPWIAPRPGNSAPFENFDFVLTPSMVEISDQTVWSGPNPGNIAPFETFEFALAGGSAGELLSKADSNSSNWNDALAPLVGLALSLSDTMSLSDSDLVQLRGGSFDFDLLASGNTVKSGSVGSEQMVLTDDPLTLTSEWDISIICPEWGALWADLASATLAVAEVLSDTLVLSDSLLLGYGDLISDQIVLSDSQVQVFQYGLVLSDTMTMSDAVQSPVVPSIAITIVDFLQMADTIPSVIGGNSLYKDSFFYAQDQINNSFVPVFPSRGFISPGRTSSVLWTESLLLNLTASGVGNLLLNLFDSIQVLVISGDAKVTVLSRSTVSAILDFKQSVTQDSATPLNSIAETLSDTLTLSDSYQQIVGIVESLSDSESANWKDFEVDNFHLTLQLTDNNTPGMQDSFTSSDPSSLYLTLEDDPWSFFFKQGNYASASFVNAIDIELPLSTTFGNTVFAQIFLNRDVVDNPSFQITGGTNPVNFQGLAVNNKVAYYVAYASSGSRTRVRFIWDGPAASALVTIAEYSGLINLKSTQNTGVGNASSTLTFNNPLMDIGAGDIPNALDFAVLGAFVGYDGNSSVWSNPIARGSVRFNFIGADGLSMQHMDGYFKGTDYVNFLTYLKAQQAPAGRWISVGGQFSTQVNAQFDDLQYVLGSSQAFLDDNFTLLDSYIQNLQVVSGALTEVLSDTMTMSDALGLGYGEGNVDALTFSDANSIGYGDLISDSFTLTDAEKNVLGMNELLSDTLVMSDSTIIGYGQATVDSLTFSDSNSVGYGDLISDSFALSDSLIIGYGQANVDSLTFSDSTSVGYGDLISDTMTLTDSEINVLGIAKLFSDTLTLTDSLAIGYGNAVSDQIVLSDSTILGYGQGTVDSLTFSDSSSLGYGDLISDTMTLSDFMLALMSIAGTFSDTIVMSDSNLLGYGDQITDTLTLSDSTIIGYGQANVDSLTFSDSSSIGYGDLISDTMSLSDSEITVLGIAELFSDTLVLSDSTIIGYGQGQVDSLTFSDTNAIGYGDLISDTLVMSDSFAFSTGGGINESFSDTLTMSDSMILGYGQGQVDSLTFSDSSSVGYGDAIVDSFTLTDSEQNVLGQVKTFADTLTMSDSTILGYGQGTVDSLTFSDSSSLGYGDQITDALSLSDSAALLFATLMGISETMTITDSDQLGYGFLISDSFTLSDSLTELLAGALVLSDTLTMSDSLIAGYGNQFVEQLTIVEGPAIGFGDLIADQMVLTDAFAFSTGQPTINLSLSDALSLSEQILAGYGNIISNTLTLADATAFIETMLVQLADATPAQLDAFQGLMTFALQVSDVGVFQDQLATTWGIIVAGESLSLADSLNAALQNVIALALADTEVANWLDAVLTSMVFAPGKITIAAMRIFPLVGGSLRVYPEASASSAKVETEV